MSCFECLLFGIGLFIVSGVLVFLAYRFSRFRWVSIVFAVVFAFVGIGLFSISGSSVSSVDYCEDVLADSVCVNASVGCPDDYVSLPAASCESPDTICCISIS